MKPEYPVNGVNSAVSSEVSVEKQEERSSINDPKSKDEELSGFSSEFLSKINSFLEIHNSFLYEDVLENASSLEKYLSVDLTSEEKNKTNGNCSDEEEIIEDEKSYVDSEKIYSSLKRYYCLRNAKETPDLPPENGNINVESPLKNLKDKYSEEIEKKMSIPDSFQLPLSNETQNAVTFDASLFENNIIDIKLPTHNSSSLSQDLTEAQRSIRLNKKSALKKNIKRKSNKKLVEPCKTKECFSPKEKLSRDVTEKPESESIISAYGNLKINSSLNVFYSIAENEKQAKQLRVTLTDFIDNSQDFKEQLKDESDVLCLEKALSKLSPKLKKSEVKANMEKDCEGTSKKLKNKSSTEKYSKKNKAPSSAFKNNSAKKAVELSSKKKGISRKKSVPRDNTIIKVKFGKKNTSKKKAALKKGNSFNKNDIAEDTDLSSNEDENELIEEEIVVAHKNLHQKKNLKSTQLFKNKTSAPVPQNSSMKNVIDGLNKTASSSGLSGISQRNSNSFLQLFNKVLESSSSETLSKSNNSIAKLFEPHDNSKLESPTKLGEVVNKKFDEEMMLRPNLSKGNGIDMADLKSIEETSAKDICLGRKRPIEDNAVVISPLKKKKSNLELVKRNSTKNNKDQISSKKDKIAKSTKVAKKQSAKHIAINQSSGKNSKKDKKLKKEINGVTFNVLNSLDVSTDPHIQGRNITLKTAAENVSSSEIFNSSAEPCSPYHSAGITESASKKRSNKKKNTTAKPIDTQSQHKTKRKLDSLVSTEPEALHSDEGLDACSFIKVTDVKSLANLNEKKNQSVKKRKSNSLIPASFSKNPKTVKKSKEKLSDSGQKNKRKNKSLHVSDLSQYENDSSYNLSELNSDNKTVKAKRKRRSTTVDPNFYYDIKTTQAITDVKTLSPNKKSMELPVKYSPKRGASGKKMDLNSEFSDADSVSGESTHDPLFQSSNDEGNFMYQNPNAMPINLASCSIHPITLEAHIVYDHDHNSAFLAVPITENLPALMSNVIPNNNMSQAPQSSFQIQKLPVQNSPAQNSLISHFISPSQYNMNPVMSYRTRSANFNQNQNFQPTVNSVPPVVLGQNTQSVFAPQNVSSAFAPQNVSSAFAPQNVSSVFAPQTVPSIVATQNVPSLNAPQNILSRAKPQTISSAVNPQNVSVSSSQAFSSNSHSLQSSNIHSNNLLNGINPHLPEFQRGGILLKNTHTRMQGAQEAAIDHNQSSHSGLLLESGIHWQSLILKKIEKNIIFGVLEKWFGRMNNFSVRDFCNNQIIIHKLCMELKDISYFDSSGIEYKFHTLTIDEPLLQVLKDFVQYYMDQVYQKIVGKSGDDLRVFFFSEVYSKFSFPICSLFGKMLPLTGQNYNIDVLTAALTFIGIVRIFHKFYKKPPMLIH